MTNKALPELSGGAGLRSGTGTAACDIGLALGRRGTNDPANGNPAKFVRTHRNASVFLVMELPALATQPLILRMACSLLACALLLGGVSHASAQPATGEVPRLSLVELRQAVSGQKRATLSFRLEGRVCAASRSHGWLTLDDGTSADLLELPTLPAELKPGDQVVIQGTNCMLGRGPFSIQIGTTAVVDIDGNHSPMTHSGSVFLQEGMRAMRVEWFNGNSDAALSLDFETPGMSRRKVPAESYWHRKPGQAGFEPGLEYVGYEGVNLISVSDFTNLKPVASGVVPDLDLSVRSRPEMSGLVFSGFLRIPRTGLYTFRLTSDDGARLSVVDTPVTCTIVPQEGVPPSEPPPARPLIATTMDQWAAFEGNVTYAAQTSNRLEMEVAGNLHSFHVTVVDGHGLDTAALLHRNIRLTGLKRESGIMVIDERQIQVVTEEDDREKILTQVFEVRELQPDDPIKSHRAAIQGVVTMVAPRSIVLQDATGGVFVHYLPNSAENPPQPSELWKIEGHTGKGDFSPVLHVDRATYLGNAALPKPVQPTQQQLASGSLDAERVEIEGIVLGVSDREMRLMTRSVKVSILDDSLYPLPTFRMPPEERAALVGAVVRLHGVYRAIWDSATGSVQSSVLMLGNATISVDEPASVDPFSAPLIRSSELLLFTSHPSALKRVRVSGQFLGSRPPELLLSDGASGFRAVTRQPADLIAGDQVEISGFPQLGGPSPVLLEAHAHKIGTAPLPSPDKIQFWNLPDPRLDSSRVEIEATLLSDTVRQEERVLEMRAGSNRFVAFMPSANPVPAGIERDSILKLTGIYVHAPVSGSDPFELRLQSAADIVVLKRGPWWTKRHTVTVIAFLSTALVVTFLWVTLLRRTVAKRSSELAVEIEDRESAERHRAMEQERSRMAKDLHDELGSGLTEAGILSSLMRNPRIPQEKKDGYLEQLGILCCTLVTGLDEIVWAVNPRYDSVADLAGYFSLYAQRFLKLADIGCRLKIDDAITGHPLDSRTRHGIFLAFKEALNNIVRHSRAKEVHLTLEVASDTLMIFLADDGEGFDLAIDHPGSDGLHNMQERMRALGGSCRIESIPTEGTTVQFKISLKEHST